MKGFCLITINTDAELRSSPALIKAKILQK